MKMSVATNEKKFVIKHTFKDFETSGPNENHESPIEWHFGFPWKIRHQEMGTFVFFYLDCLKSQEKSDWTIDTTINGKCQKREGQITFPTNKRSYSQSAIDNCHLHWVYNKDCVIDGNLTVKLEVKIDQITGIELQKLRNFDDDEAKELSDVVLSVGDHKFYVYKGYLCLHSTYFKALFSGNFSESKKSEIELKDIDPDDFQRFLELIYGELLVKDFSVLGILQLADFFDSKAAIRRCEEFLVDKSTLSLKDKFHAATKYKLEKLKKKCLSEIETTADISSIIPDDPSQFDYSLWKELLLKSNSMSK